MMAPAATLSTAARTRSTSGRLWKRRDELRAARELDAVADAAGRDVGDAGQDEEQAHRDQYLVLPRKS